MFRKNVLIFKNIAELLACQVKLVSAQRLF